MGRESPPPHRGENSQAERQEAEARMEKLWKIIEQFKRYLIDRASDMSDGWNNEFAALAAALHTLTGENNASIDDVIHLIGRIEINSHAASSCRDVLLNLLNELRATRGGGPGARAK